MGSARRRLMMLISVFVAALSAVAWPAAGVAHAATITPLAAAYQVAADTANGYLFISEGTSPSYEPSITDSTILVTDLSGNPVATLPGPQAIGGMTLSPDGTTLYVVQASGVTAYSTATLQQTSFYNIGFPAYSVAVQSGQLWVTYGEGGGNFTIGSLDPSTGAFNATAFPVGWTLFAPQVSADPTGASGVLVTQRIGETPRTVASFNVSNPAAVTEVASSDSLPSCGLPNGLAVMPGGAGFVCDGVLYSPADMSEQGSYVSGAVTGVAADGTVAVAAPPPAGNPDTTPDLFVFPPGSVNYPNYKTAFTLETPTAAVAALAWPAGSDTTLYAVIQTTDSAGDPLSFAVQALDARAETTLTLTGPATAKPHARVTLTGQLITQLTGTSAPLPGAQVTITRSITRAGKTQTETLLATTAADGTFTVPDRLRGRGTYTYTATFAGDPEDAPATSAPLTLVAQPAQ